MLARPLNVLEVIEKMPANTPPKNAYKRLQIAYESSSALHKHARNEKLQTPSMIAAKRGLLVVIEWLFNSKEHRLHHPVILDCDNQGVDTLGYAVQYHDLNAALPAEKSAEQIDIEQRRKIIDIIFEHSKSVSLRTLDIAMGRKGTATLNLYFLKKYLQRWPLDLHLSAADHPELILFYKNENLINEKNWLHVFDSALSSAIHKLDDTTINTLLTYTDFALSNLASVKVELDLLLEDTQNKNAASYRFLFNLIINNQKMFLAEPKYIYGLGSFIFSYYGQGPELEKFLTLTKQLSIQTLLNTRAEQKNLLQLFAYHVALDYKAQVINKESFQIMRDACGKENIQFDLDDLPQESGVTKMNSLAYLSDIFPLLTQHSKLDLLETTIYFLLQPDVKYPWNVQDIQDFWQKNLLKVEFPQKVLRDAMAHAVSYFIYDHCHFDTFNHVLAIYHSVRDQLTFTLSLQLPEITFNRVSAQSQECFFKMLVLFDADEQEKLLNMRLASEGVTVEKIMHLLGKNMHLSANSFFAEKKKDLASSEYSFTVATPKTNHSCGR